MNKKLILYFFQNFVHFKITDKSKCFDEKYSIKTIKFQKIYWLKL